MERTRHKEANRFKFIPFSERISNINVDVFHRVPHRFEEESENGDTHCHQAVQKWSVLNLTENWRTFKKQLAGKIQTLPQLLNYKTELFELFVKHISTQNALSIQPVLELLVAFVKDLRHEFYPFYPNILEELIKLLKSKDTDILESVFSCLAYVFKYLSRELVKDLDKVLVHLAPLLDDRNPAYVRDFAAQSFSFVARKVKDKKKFITLVLHTVQSSPQLLKGCSQLVFEVMCGINGRSHSCAEDMLRVLFTSFGDDALPQKLLFTFVSHVTRAYVENISPQYSILFTLLVVVLNEQRENNPKALKPLLKIILLALKHQSGSHLRNPTTLSEALLHLLSMKSLNVDTLKTVVDICAWLLLSKSIKLPQDIAIKMTRKVMLIDEVPVILDFIEDVSTYSGFEIYVLPRALEVFTAMSDLEFVRTLAKVIAQKTGTEINRAEPTPKYRLQNNTSTVQLSNRLVKSLQDSNQNLEILLCTLITVRHLELTDEKTLVRLVSEIAEKALLDLEKSCEEREKQLFLLCTSMETLLHFKAEYKNGGNTSKKDTFVSTLLPILQNGNSILALRTTDLFLELHDDFYCDELLEVIQNCLVSPKSNARLLALNALQKLERARCNNKMASVLQICLDCELVPLTIASYREKLKILDRLNFESLNDLEEHQFKVPLKYLLGVLYCNFQLIWDPVSQLIATYSIGMAAVNFWEVLFAQLQASTAATKQTTHENAPLPDFTYDFLLYSLRLVEGEEKTDYCNYRYLLWKTMSLFPDICETKNRDVVALYLDFVHEELLKSSLEHQKTLNIKQNESGSREPNMDGTCAPLAVRVSSSMIAKWAVAKLTLLAKFKNPKQCYRETEVRTSYQELLLHKNPDVQKAALECLLAYKFYYMTPYKQNLRDLIDDAKFKGEIVRFQIDKENGIVEESHRRELMPVVLRILNSKMLTKSTNQRGNKGSMNLLKRSLVMRFLAGCHQWEIKLFLEMAFNSLNINFEDDALSQIKRMSDIDLEKVTPIKKLQNAINLLHVVLEHIGGLMDVEIQRCTLRIILNIGAIVTGIFLKREDVHIGYVTSIRNLRTSIVDCLSKFFDRFQLFPWAEDEIEATFTVFVWPNMTKLPVEGVHSPTAILKLFFIWAQNPRYFPLLVRHERNDSTMTPLPYVMKLLLNEQARPAVTSYIGTILERLLTLQVEEPTEEEELPISLDIKYTLHVDESAIEKLTLKEELNFGSKILLPHVGSILEFIRRQLEKSEGRGLGKSEVVVLSRVTEMATSAEHGDALMSLLLKLLARKKQSDEEVLVNMITTVLHLTNLVKSPFSYVRSLAVLFGTLELVQARKILIKTLLNISRLCPDFQTPVNIIQDLNAYDTRWVDQPNFDKRLDAFKRIRALGQEEKISVELGVIILHNCFYFVKCVTDLSLRDCSTFCLKEMCPLLATSLKNRPADLQFFIESVLKLSKGGIVSEDDNIKSVAISLLGAMARDCGDLHPVLKDLSLLTNKTDLEVDFFENAQHLQIYRRLRALLKFCSIAKTLKKAPSTRTLTQFILPLASRYLCCEKYAGKNSLVDAAIECVAAVCRLLPWHHYQTVLRYYLLKLRTKVEHQRQLIRIVIAVMDAFHFDLSNSSSKHLALGKAKLNEAELEKITHEAGGLEERKSEEIKPPQPMELGDIEEGNTEYETSTKVDIISVEKTSAETTMEMPVETVDKKIATEMEVDSASDDAVASGKNVTDSASPTAKSAESLDEAMKMEIEKITDESTDLEKVGPHFSQENGEEAIPEKEDLLEELLETEPGEAEDEKVEEAEDVPVMDRLTVMTPAAAAKIERAVTHSLLDQLNKVIAQRTQIDVSHKLNRKQLGPDKDEEDVLRIPVAVTLVKLLQKMPSRMLETQLPGIFMKLCTFLKSRLESVRRITRETLQQIIKSLGPRYLPTLFGEMCALLTRGFQVHVLVFTMHAVIQSVQNLLKPGDIDVTLSKIIEVCKADLFGASSEEKDVIQIQKKHSEARSTKSYHLLHLCAQYVTENRVTDLLIPVREVLGTSHSHKIVTKCRECLRQIVLGLSSNGFVSSDSLLEIVYGAASESVPQLMPAVRGQQKKRNSKERQDCFIIPAQPKSRTGISSNPVKNNAKTNAHIIVEFGLQLFLILLKAEKLRNTKKDFKTYLDPIVPILTKALQSQHVKVTTLALQCLSRIVKHDLPNLKADMKTIVTSLFSILHKYGAAGLSKGDNFDLVLAAFKTMSMVIRDVDYHGVDADQLKILLLYAEQDIYDTSRQATAFTLLKTILKRKLNVPELNELMEKVAALSVTSDVPHVRLQARQAVFQYMMDYPLRKKLEDFIGFFISQLGFEIESGRQSALEMIHSFITTFPQNVLSQQSGLFLLTLGARLVNDDSPDCKKMVSGVVKAMLGRLEVSQRDRLFEILLVWLQQKKLSHKRLAAQMAGMFVDVEKAAFTNRLNDLLPLLQKQFVGDDRPGRFVRPLPDNANNDQMSDHHIFQVMQLLLKICRNSPALLTDEKYENCVNVLTETSQSLLCHPHEWVRLSASQFLGFVLTSLTPQAVAAALNGQPINSTSSFLDPASVHSRVKSLVLDHCAQFLPGIEIAPEFLEQATKNLVFFARVLKDVKTSGSENQADRDEDEDDEVKPKMSLLWLVRRMRRIVNMEVAQAPTSYTLRTAVLKWIGAVAYCLSREELSRVLYNLIAPIVREREIAETDTMESPIKSLVMEVSEAVKKKVGVEEYSKEATRLQTRMLEKRSKRKSQRAQEFVTDPERAAKRKIERQVKKKEAKKRKIEKLKSGQRSKMRKKKKVDDLF